MSDPDFCAASMTRVPDERPAMTRFRNGKCCLRGGVPGGNSHSTAPPEAMMRSASFLFFAG